MSFGWLWAVAAIGIAPKAHITKPIVFGRKCIRNPVFTKSVKPEYAVILHLETTLVKKSNLNGKFGLISLKKSLVFGVARLATALILLNDRC
ncbi:hypothetical protein [Falsiruegeria mediterranea]|uniref:hypothetical protein n=1 Tax=Falsiruegeria mediterranea TaxID=1280832 RepID=UPI0014021CAE|nr:hypothetical protein [Falsiruegeria mediterranea]